MSHRFLALVPPVAASIQSRKLLVNIRRFSLRHRLRWKSSWVPPKSQITLRTPKTYNSSGSLSTTWKSKTRWRRRSWLIRSWRWISYSRRLGQKSMKANVETSSYLTRINSYRRRWLRCRLDWMRGKTKRRFLIRPLTCIGRRSSLWQSKTRKT